MNFVIDVICDYCKSQGVTERCVHKVGTLPSWFDTDSYTSFTSYGSNNEEISGTNTETFDSLCDYCKEVMDREGIPRTRFCFHKTDFIPRWFHNRNPSEPVTMYDSDGEEIPGLIDEMGVPSAE